MGRPVALGRLIALLRGGGLDQQFDAAIALGEMDDGRALSGLQEARRALDAKRDPDGELRQAMDNSMGEIKAMARLRRG